MRFVLGMRQSGVTDARALSALERTPRMAFAPDHLEGLAMDDIPLPLPHGQTMTKPSLIGRIVTALAPQAEDGVLEVGAGSGYQSAVIAALARKVVTVERWRDLAAEARTRMGRARLLHVLVHAGDGFEGWTDDAPYDRIVINAAVEDLPLPLLDQLKPGGVLIAPVGQSDGQRLVRYRNGEREDLGAVRFSPLERNLGDLETTA
ncbi:MAG: protein-L-isoaspartate(D-aspartate) O-methyltransferase [Proteobacteria bacterium]|nr:protein-L-isoaspartate(D-aspartate) O-methyltransferase [Pseudomonadota bacterium]